MTKLGIRYYDPTLGQFAQVDLTGQDAHHVYADNNPCNFVDLTGASSECVTGVIGGVAGAAGFVAEPSP